MRQLFFLIFALFFAKNLFSQEINCSIQVSHQKIQGTNVEVFKTLQKELYEFINNRNWTEHIYDNEKYDERIECSILINLNEQVSSDEYKGTVQIVARRPVYGTSYNTVLFKHKDEDFKFKYVEFEPIEFSESSFTSNLSSVLVYYIYVILGMDYDSFSSEGGTVFFDKAQTIVSNAQSTNYKGWKAFGDSKNRYWLLDNITEERASPIRSTIYQYHRLGLDAMAKKASKGRAQVFESLKNLRQVYRNNSSSIFLKLFLETKADEIVNIFSDESVFPDEKNQIIMLLKEIDAINEQKYQKIKTGGK